MPTCTINGREVTVPAGTTILRAAEQLGIAIPYFCFHPGLKAPANCRMCLVEIEGMPKLEPSCRTPVRDGMVVCTESPRVVEARRGVLEFILVNHPVDCPICDQAGECWLQDHYRDYDFQPSRLKTGKVSKVKVHPIGREVVYDGERCILCTRCIRFCDEITRTSELTVVERGDTSEIRTFPGRRLDNAYSMCTADLCPVGALTTRQFRFKRRVWFLQTAKSICVGCARNCSVHLDHYRQRAERYVPRYHPEVNQWWMCDAGRHTITDLNDDRQLLIQVGSMTYEHWPEALGPIADRFASPRKDEGSAPRRWAMVLSPQSTLEGLWAAIQFGRLCLGRARLFRGGRPRGMGDEFLIRADKNPNNAGLDRVAQGQQVDSVEALVTAIEQNEIDALYLMGIHLPFQSESLRQRFDSAVSGLDLLVIQGTWKTVVAQHADVVLPVATHAEQAGTFINCEGIVQRVEAAFPPRGSSLPDWAIFQRLARAAKTPLPLSDVRDALADLGLEVTQKAVGDPETQRLRAPHGPQRPIPRRDVFPVPGRRK